METKAYNIQSPEQIAKDYGGNKQKIAEAMQMGVVDPTAGTLAGMFIDRMRSAAQAEQAPQQTVAQQVFAPPAPPAPMGGVGAPPPVPPQGAPAGLGTTPEAAQMQSATPEMPAPEEEAPMGMAGGGLTSLPIPDTMFDEPNNGGYADGGIVAFGTGAAVSDPYSWMGAPVTSRYGDKRSTGTHEGDDYAVPGGTPIGAPVPGKVIKVGNDATNGNFVRILHPDGRSSSYSHLSKATVREGDEIGTGAILGLSGNTGRVRGKNGGFHVHVGARDVDGNRISPQDFFDATKSQVASGKFRREMPKRDASTAQGFTDSLDDVADVVERRFGKSAEEKATDEAITARAKEMASPEYEAKERKDSMWQTLASIGFNMASSKSPYLLQAVGEAAAAALPGAIADKKERKQLKDKALNLMVANGAKNRKDAMDKFSLALQMQQAQLGQEQFGQKLDISERELKLKRDQLNAEIAAAKNTGMNVTSMVFSMFNSGDPAMKLAAEEWIRLNNPPSGTGTSSEERLKEIQKGRAGGAQPKVINVGTIETPK